ncbi:MAG: methionine adenosyltransferase, partial [Planctomycetota bacterium]
MIEIVKTAEFVCAGHPDKVADQIADTLLDACLQKDKFSRTAFEILVKSNTIVVAGEVTSKCNIENILNKKIREVVKEIGYINNGYQFCFDNLNIINLLNSQSEDIAMGVTKENDKVGAGDQGIMIGYATDETDEFLPFQYSLARKIILQAEEVRQKRLIEYLGPDGKTQVSILFDNDKPTKILDVVLSLQHYEEKSIEKLRSDFIEYILSPVLPKELWDGNTKNIYINHTGRFIKGGPDADCGLTGRKITIDTYGSEVPAGGGAFSGKDPSKVDRSFAYFARFIAKNIVANKLAKKCLITFAFVIGAEKPINFEIQTFGTAKLEKNKIKQLITKNF